MFTKLMFKNFRALENAELPLGPVTVIVGPNGSGKSTALLGLKFLIRGPEDVPLDSFISARLRSDVGAVVSVGLESRDGDLVGTRLSEYSRKSGSWEKTGKVRSRVLSDVEPPDVLFQSLNRTRFFELNEKQISAPVALTTKPELKEDGSGLAGFLDAMRDREPERFESLNRELNEWLPEFDRVIFTVPENGKRAIGLRQKNSKDTIPAKSLSSGTLVALVYLALVFDPEPPPLIVLEEPDRGIHPRLLRQLQDAIYRLAYPKPGRAPVQVICTTHSPYFLDLFSDHPEEIVIAEKADISTKFVRLCDTPNIQEILDGAPLGDIWYSGILGGVPTES